jgi:phosphoglycolate phosphatase-like HAD superfamily hydrolase
MKEYKLIFWDFDGVIKESVEVKTKAFVKLFAAYDSEVQNFVKEHHEANGGMSRFVKIPIYLKYAGEAVTDEEVNRVAKKFSKLVYDEVVNCEWVNGAEFYLRSNPYNQIFILVSATPQKEIESILLALGLYEVFKLIFGAPMSKEEAISTTLQNLKIHHSECTMIGDAKADYIAAKSNEVDFILRKHNSNADVFLNYDGISINDITELL